MEAIFVWMLFVASNVPGSYPILQPYEEETDCVRQMNDIRLKVESDPKLKKQGYKADCYKVRLVLSAGEGI